MTTTKTCFQCHRWRIRTEHEHKILDSFPSLYAISWKITQVKVNPHRYASTRHRVQSWRCGVVDWPLQRLVVQLKNKKSYVRIGDPRWPQSRLNEVILYASDYLEKRPLIRVMWLTIFTCAGVMFFLYLSRIHCECAGRRPTARHNQTSASEARLYSSLLCGHHRMPAPRTATYLRAIRQWFHLRFDCNSTALRHSTTYVTTVDCFNEDYINKL